MTKKKKMASKDMIAGYNSSQGRWNISDVSEKDKFVLYFKNLKRLKPENIFMTYIARILLDVLPRF